MSADSFATAFRTGAAGALRSADAGRAVRLAGWVHRRRDLGGLIFLDLRDREGIVQISFDPLWTPAEVLAAAAALGAEDVIQVEGEVHPRIKPNPEMPTGEIEIRGVALRVLARSEPPAIPVYRAPDEELAAEDLRLRFRPLDLRRAELQRALGLRHRAAQTVRGFLAGQGFWEIETPILTKRTPEGARDYLVPSRVHPGEFYALPQSPQLYKQLLMVSGYDRYFQIARCLRDEDLRADRQPEFTQIDVEMAFVDQEDVFRIGEGMIAAVWREALGVEIPTPWPRLTYHEAMLRFGSDKPDLRFGLEIVELTDALAPAASPIVAGAIEQKHRLRGLRVPGGGTLSRKELEEVQEVARRAGAPGLLWAKRTDSGWAAGPLAKVIESLPDPAPLLAATGAQVGDLLVVVAGRFRSGPGEGAAAPGPALEPALDALRRFFAARLDLVAADAHAWAWVTEFPLFDWDQESGRLVSAHHPFTAPHPDDLAAIRAATDAEGPIDPDRAKRLVQSDPRSLAYDAVYNGNELASGSVRIHDSDLQARIFRALGIGGEEAQSRFGFLLDAFRFGAPPHAGVAFGFDRIAMLLAGASSLRDVIAFPKTTSARALFEGAPSPVASDELRDLHVATLHSGAGREPVADEPNQA